MEKCSVISVLSPEVFVKLMVLVLYWQYEPVKKTDVFKCGMVTVRDVAKIITFLGLATADQARMICSPVDGINYRAIIQRYSGMYINGTQVLDNYSWLIFRQYGKGASQGIRPQSFVSNRLFGLTELGAEKAITFEDFFRQYGLTKEFYLEARP